MKDNQPIKQHRETVKHHSEKTQGAQVGRQFTHSVFSGPVPDPETLKSYEEIQPGMADRLIKLTESEQAFRHQNEKEKRENERIVIANIDKQHIRDTASFQRGQLYALLSVIIIVLLCGLGFILGYPKEAMYIACFVIVSLTGVFVIRKIVFPNFNPGKGSEEKSESDTK